MTILVNNTPAVLRADIAFDYVAKNSLFDNKDGYTLEITFPLKDCLTNQQIFGVTEAIPDSISTRSRTASPVRRSGSRRTTRTDRRAESVGRHYGKHHVVG